MIRMHMILRAWACLVVTASVGGMLLTSTPRALAADGSSDSVVAMHAFVDAWNEADLDSVLDQFTADATIEGSGGCCAAIGTDQIAPFLSARFADSYHIGWSEPEVSGDRVIMWSRISANDGLDEQVDLTQNGGPDDPQSAPIEAILRDGKISSLHLGTSPAALARASARRTAGELAASDATLQLTPQPIAGHTD
jgi:hypothetical protein